MAEAKKRAIEPIGCVALVMALAMFPVAAHVAQSPPVPKSTFFWILLLGLPAGALVLALISFGRRSLNPQRHYLSAIPALAIFLATLPAMMAIRIAGEMPLSRAVTNNAIWSAYIGEIIHEGCLPYAASHAGSFPSDLSGITPARSRFGFDYPNIDGKTIYLGTGLKDDVEPTDKIVVLYTTSALPVYIFDNYDTFTEMGRIVGFADGHTEIVPASHLAELFTKSNAARAKVGLPIVAPDADPYSRPASAPARE